MRRVRAPSTILDGEEDRPLDLPLSLLLGLGLAASVGFRIFVPFLLVSIAAQAGHLELAPGFAWLGTGPVLIMLAVATLLEIAAYHVPLVDHLLDTVATPAAAICGVLLVAATVVELDPAVRWPVAVIGGGAAAGLVQGATASLRVGTTAVTGGLGNPAFTAFETTGAVVLAGLALLLPLLAGALLLLVIALAWRRLRSLRRHR
jgi:hypothetical protein